MKQLLLLLALAIPSFAQLPAVDYAGMFFSTTQVISSVPIRKVSTLPATCTAVGSAASSNAVLYQGRVYMCTATDTWTAVVTTSTGANLALSNLASVAINTHLLPGTVNAVDLGSTTKWFRDAYIGTSGSFYSKFTTTPTANRTVTFPDASITVAGSASALTSGRVPYVTTGGLLTNSAALQVAFLGGTAPSNGALSVSSTTNAAIYTVGPDAGLQLWTNITPSFAAKLGFQGAGNSLEFGTYNGSTWRYNAFGIANGALDNTLRVFGSGRIGVNISANTTAAWLLVSNAATDIGTVIRGAASQSANLLELQNSSGTALTTIDAAGRVYPVTTAFASLGTPADGAVVYCNDCTKATPCAGAGTGALAKRLNGAWDCD